MILNQINSKINYTQSSYISSLDLLNKFNIRSLNICPRIDKVVITLNLSSLLDRFLDDSDNQIRIFFLFYLLFSSAPCIKAKYIKSLKISRTNILLRIHLRDVPSINEFLVKFFLENNVKVNLENLNLQLTQKNLIGNKFIFSTSCEISKFLDVSNFLKRILINFRPNEFFFELKFIFLNFPLKLNKINLIRNQFLFWNS